MALNDLSFNLCDLVPLWQFVFYEVKHQVATSSQPFNNKKQVTYKKIKWIVRKLKH